MPKPKIRLLQITNNLGIGGLERVVVNLCRHIDRRQFEVAACCLNFKGAFAADLEAIGIPVFLNPCNGRKSYWGNYRGVKAILDDFKPDIVHTHNTNALLDSFPASCLSQIPVRVHTDHARNFPDKPKYMLAEHLMAYRLKKIIAVSEETRANLVKYEKIPSAKIVIINNGIDKEGYDIQIDISIKKRSLGLGQFDHVVGLGVRFTPQKGIIHLIHAAPAILKEFPRTAFYIAGYGILRESLVEEVEKLGLTNHFVFPGPRQDIPEILQVLDVYVLPSEWEGLPLVLLEAMAAKRAIVATDVGANRVAVESGHSGFIVPPKNPKTLAAKINRLLADRKLREQFGEQAYRRFIDHFSAERMVAEHEKLYRSLIP
jgi:glycosyltransferase involved in cell wall biosynthesis